MANLNIAIEIAAKTGGAVGPIGQLRNVLGGLRDTAQQGFSGLQNIAVLAGGAALAGVGALAAGVTALGTAAISAWGDYDAAVDAIAVGTGKTGAVLDAMGQSVLNLSTSAAGVNQDMEVMGQVLAEVSTRTGATGASLETFTGGILTLSRVAGIDAVGSVENITRVMGDWGVQMDDSGGLMDKLLVASQNSGIGIDTLSEKLVQFGAPLRQMGFGIDESIALFAKWEKEGVNSELVMGSLRIAAGHFAKAQGEVTEEVIGGVDSMAEAEKQMAKLKQQLNLATLKQSEWTDKTKESTKVQSQMKIEQLTGQINELAAAMALGEKHTVSTTATTVSLKDSLMETFNSIKNAPSDTEALGLAMEVFGARAGPDMAAAIREGRFAIEDLVALIGDSEGALNDAGESTLDFADRFGLIKQKVMNSLIPTGQIIMDLADRALPLLGTAAGVVADFFTNTFAPGVQSVIDAFDEGGLAGVLDLVSQKIPALEGAAMAIGTFVAGLQAGQSPLTAFIEAIRGLAPPEVTAFLVSLRDDILPGLSAWFTDNVTPVMDMVTEFVSWKDVLIALGVVAASIVLPALYGVVAAAAPVVLVGAALVGAIALARTAWETDWGGIRTAVATALDFLQPKFEASKAIIDGFTGEVIPPLQLAWETLGEVWRTDIGPALDELWLALDELFTELGIGTGETDLWSVALGALKLILAGVVIGVKLLTPILHLVADEIKFGIHMVKGFVDGLTSMQRAAENILSPLQAVADKIGALISQALQMPAWLIPGSPTPFEVGLRGIGAAARALPSLGEAFALPGSALTPTPGLRSAASPTGRGGFGQGQALPLQGGGGGITIGTITINANSRAEGEEAGRGFVDLLRRQGLGVGV